MCPVSHYAPAFLILSKGQELRSGVTVDVMSVSVSETINQADSFTFSVRDRNPEPGRLFAGGERLQWLDSDVFDEGNAVEIHMGYVDDLQLMLIGKITAVTCSFPTSGQPSLSVQGMSLYERLIHGHRRKPFKSATDSGIAEEVADDLNLDVQVDPTQAQQPLVSPAGKTYAQILSERARRIGFEVTVKGKTLYFQQPRYLVSPDPTLTLEWGKDLVSFTPRLSTANAITEVTVRGAQSSQGRGKAPLVGTAQTGAERVRMGEQLGHEIARDAFGAQSLLLEDHDVVSQEEANEMALAHLEARGMGFIQGDGACIGNPSLRSRTVIELAGLGKRFSGKYYVEQTSHTIDSGGYRTTFRVKRNAR